MMVLFVLSANLLRHKTKASKSTSKYTCFEAIVCVAESVSKAKIQRENNKQL